MSVEDRSEQGGGENFAAPTPEQALDNLTSAESSSEVLTEIGARGRRAAEELSAALEESGVDVGQDKLLAASISTLMAEASPDDYPGSSSDYETKAREAAARNEAAFRAFAGIDDELAGRYACAAVAAYDRHPSATNDEAQTLARLGIRDRDRAGSNVQSEWARKFIDSMSQRRLREQEESSKEAA